MRFKIATIIGPCVYVQDALMAKKYVVQLGSPEETRVFCREPNKAPYMLKHFSVNMYAKQLVAIALFPRARN